MKCDHCKKEATVHLTSIRQGKLTKAEFCEEHARLNNVLDPSPKTACFEWQGILEQFGYSPK